MVLVFGRGPEAHTNTPNKNLKAEKTKPTGGGGSGGLRYFVPAREEEIAGTTARSWEEEYDQADCLAGEFPVAVD